MNAVVAMLVGASWKTSLSGLAVAVCIAVVAYAQARTEPIWYLVAIAFAALGRFAKDADKSNAPAPTPVAGPVPPAP